MWTACSLLLSTARSQHAARLPRTPSDKRAQKKWRESKKKKDKIKLDLHADLETRLMSF